MHATRYNHIAVLHSLSRKYPMISAIIEAVRRTLATIRTLHSNAVDHRPWYVMGVNLARQQPGLS